MTQHEPSVFQSGTGVAHHAVRCGGAIEAEGQERPPGFAELAWKVLIVDDDASVHEVTRFILRDFVFDGRSIEFLSAYSGHEAIDVMAQEQGIALCLLDVVMESEDAGLRVVDHIRTRLGNRLTRIIVRTGQPGRAPESRVALEYDIHDYREKTELTSTKFYSSIYSALRAYRDMSALDFNRKGFQAVSDTTGWLFRSHVLDHFTRGVIERLVGLLRIEPGVDPSRIGALVTGAQDGHDVVVAATGTLQSHQGKRLADLADQGILEAVRAAPVGVPATMIRDGLLCARLRTEKGHEHVFYAQCGVVGIPQVAGFVELFLRNVSIALDNIHLQRDLTHEIGERREAERSAEILARLPGELPEPVVRVSADGVVTYANRSSEPVLSHFGSSVGGWLPEPWRARMADIVASGRRFDVEIEQDGRIFEMSFSPVPEAGYANLFGRDVSEYRKLVQRMEHAAFHDHLTGIANRLYFKRSVEQAVTVAHRYGGQIGLMLVDLNHFKQLNDVWGHEAGDLALKEVAARLAVVVRSSEVVARLGGDEFGIVIPRLKAISDMQGLAERINASLEEPVQVGERTWKLSCAIGLTSFPADADSADALMRCADLAMYHAKRDGSAGFRYYDIEIHKGVRRRTEMELTLHRALAADMFEVYYQPIVGLEDGGLRGCEALLRMRDAEGGVVLPGEFIHVAEDSGLIEPIGRWLFEKVCADINAWRSVGLDVGRVAVNVSARQFRDRDLSRRIESVLHRSGVAAAMIEVEITESVLVGDEAGVLRILGELREIGLSLAIDDFGTGYSSLSYLRRLPVSRLKIDRSFVADMLSSRDASVIIDAILSLGNSLGLKVLAEGIEQAEQLERLRALSCREGQGYHFGRPMPYEAFKTRLRSEQRGCEPLQ